MDENEMLKQFSEYMKDKGVDIEKEEESDKTRAENVLESHEKVREAAHKVTSAILALVMLKPTDETSIELFSAAMLVNAYVSMTSDMLDSIVKKHYEEDK